VRNPAHIETLDAQPEVLGVEASGSFDVSDWKVRNNAGYLHLSSLTESNHGIGTLDNYVMERIVDTPQSAVMGFSTNVGRKSTNSDWRVNARE